MRSRSLLVMPSRMPLSISLRLTQSSNVAGTQPIFGAMDSTAAHSEGYSPRCSCTKRTARSRTSGENLFCLLIVAPFSQRLEPPQNPGRFISSGFCKPPKRFFLRLLLLQRFTGDSHADRITQGEGLGTDKHGNIGRWLGRLEGDGRNSRNGGHRGGLGHAGGDVYSA